MDNPINALYSKLQKDRRLIKDSTRHGYRADSKQGRGIQKASEERGALGGGG